MPKGTPEVGPTVRSVAIVVAFALWSTTFGATTVAASRAGNGDDTMARSSVERLAGSDRYETTAAVSRATFPTGAPTVVIATGTSFADALAAAPLAAISDGPVLLTGRSRLPEATRTELSRLDPARVVVLGGPAAIDDAVVEAIRLLGFPTDRVGGGNRYATAAKASAATHTAGVPGVVVASGASFADSLLAAAVAAERRLPLLLAHPGRAPDETLAELERLRPDAVWLVGGGGAVGENVAGLLGLAADAPVERIHGSNRFHTAAAVTKRFWTSSTTATLATGRTFPDALAGAWLAGATGAPVILSRPTCLDELGLAELDRLGASDLTLLGGTAALGPGVAALETCSPLAAMTVPDDPDLTGVRREFVLRPGEALDRVVVTDDAVVLAAGARRPTLHVDDGTIVGLSDPDLGTLDIDLDLVEGSLTISPAQSELVTEPVTVLLSELDRALVGAPATRRTAVSSRATRVAADSAVATATVRGTVEAVIGFDGLPTDGSLPLSWSVEHRTACHVDATCEVAEGFFDGTTLRFLADLVAEVRVDSVPVADLEPDRLEECVADLNRDARDLAEFGVVISLVSLALTVLVPPGSAVAAGIGALLSIAGGVVSGWGLQVEHRGALAQCVRWVVEQQVQRAAVERFDGTEVAFGVVLHPDEGWSADPSAVDFTTTIAIPSSGALPAAFERVVLDSVIGIEIVEQPSVAPGENAPLRWRLTGTPREYPVRWSYVNRSCPSGRSCGSHSGQVDGADDHDQAVQAGVFCHDDLSAPATYAYDLWVNDSPGTDRRVTTSVSWVCSPPGDGPGGEPPASADRIVGDWDEPFVGSYLVSGPTGGPWVGRLGSTNPSFPCSGRTVWEIESYDGASGIYSGFRRFYDGDCHETGTGPATWELLDDDTLVWRYLSAGGPVEREFFRVG